MRLIGANPINDMSLDDRYLLSADNQIPVKFGPIRTFIEGIFDVIAARLGYERPRGQYWPELLMVLPITVFSIYILSGLVNLVTGDALSRAWSPVETRWPIVQTIEIVADFLSFLLLAAFAIFHGIRIRRTSTTVLGVLLLLLPAAVVWLMMIPRH
jgi:hypothetical protein